MSFTNDITIILTPKDETKCQEVKLYAANDYVSRFQLMEDAYTVTVGKCRKRWLSCFQCSINMACQLR